MSSMNLAPDVANANQQFRDGDADGALATLAGYLAANPDDLSALQLAIMIHDRAGRPAEALAALERAAAAGLDGVGLHGMRARLMTALGRPRDAVADLERWVALQPRSRQAWLERARTFEQLGRFDEALASHQAILGLSPGEPAAIAGTAFCLAGLGRNEEALAAYDAVLRRLPDQPDIQFNRARCLEDLGRHQEALEAYDRYLAACPHERDVQIQRAVALFSLDRLEEARIALDQADPRSRDPEALANKGAVLLALGDGAAAWSAYDDALRLLTGEPPEHEPKLRYHRGLCALYLQDLPRAWPDYESRWAAGMIDPPALDRGEPRWNGEPVPGTLRIWREQPIGEEVLFSRLVPLAASRAGRTVLECSARMAPLFRRSFPDIEVRCQGQVDGGADAQISMASLGLATGAGAADLRGDAYLKADPGLVAECRARYEAAARGRPIIGIAWFSKNHRLGAQKSAALSEWEALLSKDALFVNLQYGDTAADVADACARFGCDILTDASVNQMEDLDRFAAQVMAMDRIVSVSNTTVHFAGALGVDCTVVVAPSRACLWYWGAEGEASPWYRSIRISRRARGEGWAGQIEAVARSLPLGDRAGPT